MSNANPKKKPKNNTMNKLMSKFEKWTVNYKNSLPDQNFALIKAGGEIDSEGRTIPLNLRTLPFKDEKGKIDVPHLRNALMLLGQKDFGLSKEEQVTALKTLKPSAKKYLASRGSDPSGLIIGSMISKFENSNKEKLQSIVDVLKEKAVNLKPDEQISFEVKNISLLIQDLEEVIADEPEVIAEKEEEKPSEEEKDSEAKAEESKFDKEETTKDGCEIFEEEPDEPSTNMKNGEFVIEIKGEIGWDVTADSVNKQLEKAKGSKVILEVASPGGSVFDGVEIFNSIRNYEGETEARIVGIAASMGSYIPLAADKVLAEDNAAYMIHNVSSMAFGDADDLKEEADLIENLNELLAQEYVNKTGKTEKEILTLMDETTWLFGDEIKKEGFVDEMIVHDEKDAKASFNKEKALADYKEQVENVLKKMSEKKDSFKDERFNELFAKKEPVEETNIVEESKFNELLKVCEGYKKVIEEKDVSISKFKERIGALETTTEELNSEMSKFKQDNYHKLVDSTVDKVSKFQNLSEKETLALKQHYLESKMSEVALEELGCTIDGQIMSKMQEPKPTTKPTEYLEPAETQPKREYSKMSDAEKMDVLASMNAKKGGFVTE